MSFARLTALILTFEWVYSSEFIDGDIRSEFFTDLSSESDGHGNADSVIAPTTEYPTFASSNGNISADIWNLFNQSNDRIIYEVSGVHIFYIRCRMGSRSCWTIMHFYLS